MTADTQVESATPRKPVRNWVDLGEGRFIDAGDTFSDDSMDEEHFRSFLLEKKSAKKIVPKGIDTTPVNKLEDHMLRESDYELSEPDEPLDIPLRESLIKTPEGLFRGKKFYPRLAAGETKEEVKRRLDDAENDDADKEAKKKAMK